MVNYTLPIDANVTNIYELFGYVQTVSEGVFFPFILFAIFITTFISLKQYENSRAFAGAAFLNLVLSIILSVLNLLSSKFMYISIILVSISAIWLYLENAR